MEESVDAENVNKTTLESVVEKMLAVAIEETLSNCIKNIEICRDDTVEGAACNYCKKPGPTKRCSKRHPKCLKKIFCDQNCETMAHKKKEDGIKVSAKKVDSKKKKKGKKEGGQGEFAYRKGEIIQ